MYAWVRDSANDSAPATNDSAAATNDCAALVPASVVLSSCYSVGGAGTGLVALEITLGTARPGAPATTDQASQSFLPLLGNCPAGDAEGQAAVGFLAVGRSLGCLTITRGTW